MAAQDSKFVKYLDKKVKVVEKPANGQNVAVYARPGDEVDLAALGMDIENANYKLVGGDLVLEVPGGGTITFVSMALMAYHENAPLLTNAGRQVSLASILANVDDINAVPVKSIATNQAVHLPDSSSDDEKKNKSDDGKSQAQAAAPVVFVDNHKDVSSNDGIGKSLDDGVDRAKAQDVSTDVGPGISMVTKTQDNTKTQTQTSQVEGIQPTLKFDIDIQHVGITETTTTTVNGKTLTVYGGGGTSYANIYPDNYNKVDKDKLVAKKLFLCNRLKPNGFL